MSKAEWVSLADRLEAANPEAYQDILVRLRRLVESNERAIAAADTDHRPRIILASPRQRISQ